MDDVINKIFDILREPRNNRDYINVLSDFENIKFVIEKYYADDEVAYFDLSNDIYNYRIYVDYVDCGKYLLEIRKNLSSIYKTYGVHWDIYYSVNDYRIITIEEREKLRVCNEKDMTCDELLLNWKITLDLLAESLDLSNILKQIKKGITTFKSIDVKNLLIVRDKLVKASDYALSINGKVILLEDIYFVLCLADYKGNIIRFKGLCLDINTTCGLMTFTRYDSVFFYKVVNVYELQEKFFIYDYSCKDKYINDTVKNYDNMLQAQIDIYLNKEPVNAKFLKEYILDYYSKMQKDNKYIIEKSDSGEIFFDGDEKRRRLS